MSVLYNDIKHQLIKNGKKKIQDPYNLEHSVAESGNKMTKIQPAIWQQVFQLKASKMHLFWILTITIT